MRFIKCNMTTWEPHLSIDFHTSGYVKCQLIRPIRYRHVRYIEEEWGMRGRGSESDWFDFSSSTSYFPLCDLSSHHIKFVMKVSCSNLDFINFCWYKCHSDGDSIFSAISWLIDIEFSQNRKLCNNQNFQNHLYVQERYVIIKQLPIHTLIYLKTFEQFVDEVGRTSVMSMWSDKTISLE